MAAATVAATAVVAATTATFLFFSEHCRVFSEHCRGGEGGSIFYFFIILHNG
jgi:hypothetical protein